MKKLTILTVLVFCLSQLFAQSGGIQLENINRFHQKLSEKLTDNEPGTAIIITQGDDIIYDAYFGLANVENEEKLHAGHVMGIASMSKQFTGMAVLCLAQDGKLNLDDDISEHLSGLPLGERKITIRRLLSHTSGLPELTQNDEFMNQIDKAHSVAQIIDVGLNGKFRSEPGERYIYCNTAYTLAVALIEKLSGMNYADFMKERVFIPLQMNDTYAADFEHDALTAVPRYVADSTGYKRAITMHFSNLIGGGGIISNVQDMAKWNMALVSGKNLPANYRLLWEPVLLNSGESTNYGLGMGISEINGETFYYHPGMGSGMNSINLIFPERKMTITVIRNISAPSVSSKDIALMAVDYLIDGKQVE